MKKLLIILGLLITLGAGAQVKVLGYVVPNSTGDNYPTHLDIYGAGGFRSVATLAERDAISTLRRRAGMLVYVVANSATYQLGNDLTTWNVPNVGGGAVGGGKNYYAGWGLILEDTVFRVDTALLAAAGIGSGGGGGGGGGTLTSFSFVNNTGVTGVVTNPFTTPSLKLTIDTNFFVTNNRLTTVVNTLNQTIKDSSSSVRNYVDASITRLVNNYFGDTTINNGGNDTTLVDGSNITIGNNVKWYIVNPTATLSSLTLTLPDSPIQGQVLEISFGGIINSGNVVNALTIAPNAGQSLLATGAYNNIEVRDKLIYRYNSANKKWYR